MSHDDPPTPITHTVAGCGAEDITDDDKAKFDYIFRNLRVSDGTFGLTRILLGDVPCTAVIFIKGYTSEDLDKFGSQSLNVTAQLEFIFVNDEILKIVRNHLGNLVNHPVFTH